MVGGGATGVETAGALAELYHHELPRRYPGVDASKARLTLVEAGPELFSMFSPNLRRYAKSALEKRGVEVMVGEVVESVTPTRVTLKSGTVLSAHTLVWGAGLQASALAPSLGVELQRGNRVPSQPDLSPRDLSRGVPGRRRRGDPRGGRRRRCRSSARWRCRAARRPGRTSRGG